MIEEKQEILQINLDDILPNRFQPRLEFGDRELQELAHSIKEHGIIQPLILRKLGTKYEVIAGERRYKASTMVGLKTVPAIIVDTDDFKSAEIAIVENVQRKNLTPIEEAYSYNKLLNKGISQTEIASKIGISQSAVANKLRLLNLTEETKDALLYNKISERHARSLLTLNDPIKEKQLLNRIMSEKLTVKQTDDEIKKLLNETPTTIEKTLPEEQEAPIEIIKEPLAKSEEDIEFVDFSGFLNKSSLTSVSENSIVNEKSNPIEEIKLENPAIELPEEKPVDKFSSLINRAREFTNNLKNNGSEISTEEFDFEDMYQIVIKIKKD